MKITTTVFAMTLVLSAPAMAAPTCRESYGQMAKSERHTGDKNLGLGAGAAVGSAAGAAILHAEGLFRLVTVTKPQVALLGGTLATIIAGAAFANLLNQERALFAEVIGTAIGEARVGQLGPATLILTEFLRAVLSHTAITKRGQIFVKFKLPQQALAPLNQAYTRSTPPTATEIQAAIIWLSHTGLICHPDNTALSPRDFTDRFVYALNLVGATS